MNNPQKAPITVIIEAAAWLAAGSFAVDNSKFLKSIGEKPEDVNYFVFGIGLFLILSGLIGSVVQEKHIRIKATKITKLLEYIPLIVFPVAMGEFIKLAYEAFTVSHINIIPTVVSLTILFIFLISMILVTFEDWLEQFWDLGKLIQLTFVFNFYAIIAYIIERQIIQFIVIFSISFILTILTMIKYSVINAKQKEKKDNHK